MISFLEVAHGLVLKVERAPSTFASCKRLIQIDRPCHLCVRGLYPCSPPPPQAARACSRHTLGSVGSSAGLRGLKEHRPREPAAWGKLRGWHGIEVSSREATACLFVPLCLASPGMF